MGKASARARAGDPPGVRDAVSSERDLDARDRLRTMPETESTQTSDRAAPNAVAPIFANVLCAIDGN